MKSITIAECLFCKIIAGQIPAQKVMEDNFFIAIRDIQPQAHHHYLVIPKTHCESLAAAFPEQGPSHFEMLGRLMEAGTELARKQGLLPDGFRAVINTNRHGGQTVYHIHLHILGGEPLKGGFGA